MRDLAQSTAELMGVNTGCVPPMPSLGLRGGVSLVTGPVGPTPKSVHDLPPLTNESDTIGMIPVPYKVPRAVLSEPLSHAPVRSGLIPVLRLIPLRRRNRADVVDFLPTHRALDGDSAKIIRQYPPQAASGQPGRRCMRSAIDRSRVATRGKCCPRRQSPAMAAALSRKSSPSRV